MLPNAGPTTCASSPPVHRGRTPPPHFGDHPDAMLQVINAAALAYSGVTHIRHAYVLPAEQRRSVGDRLLAHLVERATGPLARGRPSLRKLGDPLL